MSIESALTDLKLGYDDIEVWRSIERHGCGSGICYNHIYYHETTDFYEKYGVEIVDYLTDTYGLSELTEVFENNDGYLPAYKNDVVWMFIESLAPTVVEEYQEEYVV
tara:strand:+ start:204 stop:524 length:321 start_codon:yes stop_codon:yes gene_type:complete